MKRRKNSGNSRQDLGPDVVECPRCGCPNRPGDNHCSYCRAELSAFPRPKTMGMIEAYLNQLRFRLKLADPIDSAKDLAKKGGTSLLGSLLLGSGLLLFYAGLTGSGTVNLLLGVLLSLYGGAMLYNTWGRKK